MNNVKLPKAIGAEYNYHFSADGDDDSAIEMVPFNTDGTTDGEKYISANEKDSQLAQTRQGLRELLYTIRKDNPLNGRNSSTLDDILNYGSFSVLPKKHQVTMTPPKESRVGYSTEITSMDQMLAMDNARIASSSYEPTIEPLIDIDDEEIDAKQIPIVQDEDEKVEIIDDFILAMIKDADDVPVIDLNDYFDHKDEDVQEKQKSEQEHKQEPNCLKNADMDKLNGLLCSKVDQSKDKEAEYPTMEVLNFRLPNVVQLVDKQKKSNQKKLHANGSIGIYDDHTGRVLDFEEYRSKKTHNQKEGKLTKTESLITRGKVTRKQKSDKKRSWRFSLKRTMVATIALGTAIVGLFAAAKFAPKFHLTKSNNVTIENNKNSFSLMNISMSKIVSDVFSTMKVSTQNLATNKATSNTNQSVKEALTSKPVVENTPDGVVIHENNISEERQNCIKTDMSSEADISDIISMQSNTLLGDHIKLNDCKIFSSSDGLMPSVETTHLKCDNYKIKKIAILSNNGKHLIKTVKVNRKFKNMGIEEFKDSCKALYGDDIKFQILVDGQKDGKTIKNVGWTAMNHIKTPLSSEKIYMNKR